MPEDPFDLALRPRPPRRPLRRGAIALGILAAFVGGLWILIVPLWVAADSSKRRDADLLLWLFTYALFAVGIVLLLVGVFLLIGRVPRRRGWLVAGALMLTPVAPLILKVLEIRDGVSTANTAAERVYMVRSGLGNVTADCRWRSKGEVFDMWGCDMASSVSRERCVIQIGRDAGPVTARIFTCRPR